MPKWDVIMDSFVCVEADNEEEAVAKARYEYMHLLQINEAVMYAEPYTEEEYLDSLDKEEP